LEKRLSLRIFTHQLENKGYGITTIYSFKQV
jgi:hypothetical protein